MPKTVTTLWEAPALAPQALLVLAQAAGWLFTRNVQHGGGFKRRTDRPRVTVRTPSNRGAVGCVLIQAAITCGTTANLAALRTKALSNVMNASSALLSARCSASAKSRPCAYRPRAALTMSAWTGLKLG